MLKCRMEHFKYFTKCCCLHVLYFDYSVTSHIIFLSSYLLLSMEGLTHFLPDKESSGLILQLLQDDVAILHCVRLCLESFAAHCHNVGV